MKQPIISIFLLSGLALSNGTDNLVSYWEFEGDLTDAANAGSSNDVGSWNGASDYDPGKFGQAIETKGNTWVTVADSSDLRGSSNNISISTWFRVVEFDTNWQALIAKGENSNWRIARRSGTNELSYAAGGEDIFGGSVNDGAWHHVLSVAEAGVASRLYIDGQLIETGSAPSINDSGLDLFIGNNPSADDRGWKGLIDDVGIFDRVLNNLEASAIYDLGDSGVFGYNLGQINQLFQLAGHPQGDSLQIGNYLWTSEDSNPNDGRTFIQLETTGGGVAGSTGPRIFSFTADHVIVPPEMPITVNWQIDAAASSIILLSQGAGNVKPITTNDRGTYTYANGFTEDVTLQIVAVGPSGNNTLEIPITVTEQPIIEYFRATPSPSSPGQAVTVEWATLNTTGVTLDGSPVSDSGTFTASPNFTTSYTLGTVNANGTNTQTLTIPVIIPGEPLIMEFMADNEGVLLDEDNDASDWIQIGNPTDIDVVINGDYYLTDDPDELDKWTIPSQIITPGASARFFASGKTGTGEPHANFSLRSEGEYLALVKISGGITTILSEFNDYPRQFTDISYGVLPDLATYLYYASPTPNGVNSGDTFTDFVRDTSFSTGRGLYTDPQSVAITSKSLDAQIYYTIDGSEPSPSNGTLYTTPLSIDRTTTLRAIGTKPSHISTNIDTQTYIFPADVLNQPNNPPGWPTTSVNGQQMDYEMDPASAIGTTEQALLDGLNAIPTWSIVTPQENLTNPATGIYVRASNRGLEWERPASVEMILPPGYVSPDGYTQGFQVDAGIRIRGGYSRNNGNPKHAFRVFFRRDYGQPSLNFPLFGLEGTDEYKGIDLRTAQNYSWSFKNFGSLTANGDNSSKNTFLREVFARDTQRELGELYTRSRYVHLYLNGIYWGLFMTQERSEAEFAESYLPGDEDDFDTVKSAGRSGGYQTEMTDGNNGDWLAGYNLAQQVDAASPSNNTLYFQLQGLDSAGVRDSNLPVHFDIDNLIHYMLVVFYNGSFDAPLSTFINASNNWYGVRNRERDDLGWKFFAHDMEHSLGSYFTNRQDRTGPFAISDNSFNRSNPQYVHQYLMRNHEYQMRFADLTHQHFFNGGVYDDSSVISRFEKREAVVDQVIDVEAARWGDSKSPSRPLNRSNWESAVAQMKSWTNGRNDEVLTQLLNDDLYPDTDAPVYSQHGGQINPGFLLTINNPNGSGTIYYTTDGSDPRLTGGAISGSAIAGASATLNNSTTVSARVRSTSGEWSALTSVDFATAGQPVAGELVISEINYHPANPTTAEETAGFTDDDDFEFIEILNTGSAAVDLSKVKVANEITFSFSTIENPSDRILAAGARVILARNPAGFTERYPGITVLGEFDGGLSNNTGIIDLFLEGALLFSVSYNDNNGWPEAADGDGYSLILKNDSADTNAPLNWRLSSAEGGNPGSTDSTPFIGLANGDDNRNGIDNLLETVIQDGNEDYLEPSVAVQRLEIGAGFQNYLVLNLRRRVNVDNTIVTVEQADALQAWDTMNIELENSLPMGDGTVIESYRYTTPLSVDSQHFMRVKVTLDN